MRPPIKELNIITHDCSSEKHTISEKESLLTVVNGIINLITEYERTLDIKFKSESSLKITYLLQISQHELLKENADIDFVKKLLNKIKNGEQTKSR